MANIELDISQTLELLENVNKAANIGIFQFEVETEIIYWNEVLRSIYEVPEDFKPSLTNVFDFIQPPDLKEQIDKAHKEAIDFGKSFEIEHTIITANGNNRFTRTIGQPVLKKGKCIYVHGVVMDITEQKEAESELAIQNQQLVLTEHIAKMGYWRWDTTNNQEVWSDYLYEIYGIKKGEKPTYDAYIGLVHPDDLDVVSEKIEKAFIDKILPVYSHRIVLKDGSIKVVLVSGQVLTNEKGEVIEMLGTCQDITNKLQVELELSQTQKKLNLTEKINRTGSWQLNLEKDEFKWTDNLYRILDLEIGTPMSFKLLRTLFHPDDIDGATKKIQKVVETKRAQTFTHRVILKNGSIKTLEISAEPLSKIDNDVTELIGTIRDITNSLSVKTDLKEKNQLLDFAEKLTTIGYWKYIPETNFIFWSDNHYRIFELSKDEQLSFESYFNQIHPEDQEFVFERINQSIKNLKFYDYTHRIVLASGAIKTIQVIGKVYKNEQDGLLELLGTSLDITESESIEHELFQKNQQLRIAEKMTMIGNWQFNAITNKVLWSDNLYNIYEHDKSEPVTFETYINYVHDVDKSDVVSKLKAGMEDGKFRASTYRIQLKDGSIKTVKSVGKINTNKNGDVVEMFGSCQDITESNQKELELSHKNQQLNLAEQMASLGSWEFTPSTEEFIWSDNLYLIYGLEPRIEITKELGLSRIHPDDLEVTQKIVRDILDGVNHESFTHRIVLDNGAIKIVEARAHTITNRDGILKIIGTTQDITEVKNKEQELLLKNQQLNIAEEMAMLGSWEWQPQKNIYKWSENLYRIYGWEPGVEISHELTLTRMHPEDMPEVTQYVREILNGAVPKHFIHRIILDNGDIRTLEIRGSSSKDNNGNVILIGTTQDITESKNNELQLLQKNQQLNEAEQLAMTGSFQFKPMSEDFIWSDNTYRIHGIEIGTPINWDTFLSYVYPKDLEYVKNSLIEVVLSKVFKNLTYRIKRTDGSIRTIESIGKVVTNKIGEVVEVIGMGRDVTEAKKNELEILQKNQQLNDAEQIAMSGSWAWNASSNAFKWSNNLYKIYDIEIGSPIDFKTFLASVHPDDQEYISKIQKELIHTKIIDNVHRAKNRNGTIKTIKAAGKIITNDKGEIIEVIGSSQDITERLQREQDLLQKNRSLNEAEQLAKSGSFHFTPNTEAFIWSDNSYRIHGFEIGIPMNFDKFLTCIHPDDLKNLKKHRAEIKITKVFKDIIYRIKHKNGIIRTIKSSGKVTINKNGEINEVIGTVRDITEQKNAENKILETNARLEKITTELMARNRQLADFNQITSHNLRAPVSNLSTLLELYNDESTDDDLKALLFSKFGVVIDHLTLTLNTLIDSLKIKNNENLVMQELSFDNTLVKTKEILVAEIIKTKAIIKSDFSITPTISYNEIYLESIFLNLIGNAIKYKSPDRIPEITIMSKSENGKTILTIKDNGLGIDLERHGDKLFGLNKVFHRHPDALGIGLFLTKAQIEAMGGSIYAESEVNVGTTFYVTLN